MTTSPVQVRPATPADVEAVTAAITTAFFDDPLWGPAFPDAGLRSEQASAFWRLFVTSALRFPWTLVTARVESAALWIPPGEDELTADDQAGFEEFLLGVAGRQVAAGILEIAGRFEAARPGEPHFYLSLLATHTAHRGAGSGTALLRETLTRIDALGMPAYLESSNPAANDRRYRDAGFVPRSEIVMPSGHTVTTMWRPPR